jgi:hypothetical protein
MGTEELTQNKIFDGIPAWQELQEKITMENIFT